MKVFSPPILSAARLAHLAPSPASGLGEAFISVKDAPFGAVGDGVTDDSVAFQTAVNALAGTGVALWIPAGTYLISTTVQIPSDSLIWGSSSAILLGNITGAYPTAGSILRSGTTGAPIASTTVTSAPLYGELINVASTAGMAAGDFVYVVSAATFRRMTYQIEQVTSPTQIRVDHPITTAFAGADLVDCFLSSQVPQRIHILGNGMRVRGKSVVAISLQRTWNSYVSDLVFDTASATNPSDANFGYNDASYSSVAERLLCDGFGGGSPSVQIASESSEAITFVDCETNNGANYGGAFVNSVQCMFVRLRAGGNAFGLVWSNDLAASPGSDYCSAIDCDLDGNTQSGFFVGAGSAYATIRGGSASGNGVSGVVVATIGTASTGTWIGGGIKLNANGSHAIDIQAGVKDTTIDGATLDRNLGIALLNAGADTNISNITAQCVTGAVGGYQQTAGSARMSNCKFAHLVGGAAAFFFNIAGAGVKFDAVNLRIELGVVGDIAVQVSGAACVARLVNFQPIAVGGAGGTTGVYTPAGGAGTAYIGDGCDFKGVAAALNQGAGTFMSRGTVVLTGAAPVAVPFPDITAGSSLILTYKTAGGTPGTAPQFTVTPGTGFNVVGIALDTSTYQFEVR